MADRASAQWGAVKYRMATVALQGSVPHADQFCKMEANTYANRACHPLSAGEENHAPGGFPDAVINILCPRPELYASAFNEVPNGGPYPGGVKPAALPPAPTPIGGHYGAPFAATIPVVPVKVPR